MRYGIDISHWQGAVDFGKVNVDFLIMKLSQKMTTDPKFETYYNSYQGIKGCYIYCKVASLSEAKQEAIHAVNALKGRPMPLGVWLDMEDAAIKKLGKSMLTQIIEAEASILQQAGYSVGIYCNKSWYESVLDSKYLVTKYPFWIARYPLIDTGIIKESLSPKALTGCVMWQYSSKGKVPGISGNVDMDVILDPTEWNTPADSSRYVVGYTYTLTTDIYVRDDANGNKVKYDALTMDGKRNAIFDDYGCAILKKGTRVTCKAVKQLATSTWIQIPSGWICAKNKTGDLIK